MLACSDADVQRLLRAMDCDGEHPAMDCLSRRKLLTKAFSKVQQGYKQAVSADGLLDASALPELPVNTQQLRKHWEKEELFSVKDCFLINSEEHYLHALEQNRRTGEQNRHPDAESYQNAWFVARRTLQAWVLRPGGAAASPLLLKAAGGMGCMLSAVGVRDVASGKASLLELRASFFQGGAAPQGFSSSRALPTEPDALRLISALLAANRALLPASYVSAQEASWPGSDAQASFLLPLRPLPAGVKLHKLCQVCSKEGASTCVGCGQAAYCSRDCQKQDWRSHKALCKPAQQQRQQQPDTAAAAGSDKGVGDSPCIVVDLTATSCNMAAMYQALSGQLSITRANELSSKGALRKPNPQQRFAVLLSGHTQQQPEMIVINIEDEKPTITSQLMSSQQQPGVCDALLQLLVQRGSPEPSSSRAGALGAGVAAAMGLPGVPDRGARCQLYAWAVLETPSRLCIITDELPSQQQSWGETGLRG